MIESEHLWLFDSEATEQVPDYLLCAGTHAYAGLEDISAGFDLSCVAQEPSTAMLVDQSFDFASLTQDVNYSAAEQNFDPAQDGGCLTACQENASAYQEIGSELSYHNTQSSLVCRYVDPAVVSQGTNICETGGALPIQHASDQILHEKLRRSLWEGAPCVLESGVGFTTASEADFGVGWGSEFETQTEIQFGNVNEHPQPGLEQLQQGERREPIESLADVTERLSKQNKRISELELALEQQQQQLQACPELLQKSVSIPQPLACF